MTPVAVRAQVARVPYRPHPIPDNASVGAPDAVTSAVPVLACADLVVLSSHMEANPLAILEAMACGKPVVATHVGSIPEIVIDGIHGFLIPPGDAETLAERCLELFRNPHLARAMGLAGHQRVAERACIERTVQGYEDLILRIYAAKCGGHVPERRPPAPPSPPRKDAESCNPAVLPRGEESPAVETTPAAV